MADQNSKFSFSSSSCFTKAKEPTLSNYAFQKGISAKETAKMKNHPGFELGQSVPFFKMITIMLSMPLMYILLNPDPVLTVAWWTFLVKDLFRFFLTAEQVQINAVMIYISHSTNILWKAMNPTIFQSDIDKYWVGCLGFMAYQTF